MKWIDAFDLFDFRAQSLDHVFLRQDLIFATAAAVSGFGRTIGGIEVNSPFPAASEEAGWAGLFGKCPHS